jgi:exodeoxyribonuclease V beta subunit
VAESVKIPPVDLTNETIGDGFVSELAIQASAGTGKTYSLTALFARLVAENENASVNNILVVTFTRNAAAKLRNDVRAQLIKLERGLRDELQDPDEFVMGMRKKLDGSRSAASRRLQIAINSLDSASIMTIDSFCAQILRLGGMVVQPDGAEQELSGRIAQAVNDVAIQAAADGSEMIDQSKFAKVVEVALRRPMAEPRFEGVHPPTDADQQAVLDRLAQVIKKVHDAAEQAMDFDEVKRQAVLLLGQDGVVLDALAEQYRYVFIDESQDTDWKQWELFDKLWEKITTKIESVGGAARVFVGDPKQSIYGFRGADVDAYLDKIETARVNHRLRSLTSNYRSDEPIITALNALLNGKQYGSGNAAEYEEVRAATAGKKLTSVDHSEAPVTLVKLDDLLRSKQDSDKSYKNITVVEPATARVVQMLLSGTGADGKPFAKSDYAVLTTAGAVARSIQSKLESVGVRAVSNSTSSVADGDTFVAWLYLAQALERPADEGRIRRVLLSSFFGYRGHDAVLLNDDDLNGYQQKFERWRSILLGDGIVKLGLELLADERVTKTFLATPSYLRRITDFGHVIELVVQYDSGGMAPQALVAVLDEIANLDKNGEGVARRVESDDDAVQVMTVHAAKGLEFPAVVVADMWNLPNKKTPRVVMKSASELQGQSNTTTKQWLEAAVANDSVPKDDPDPSIFKRDKEQRRLEKTRLFYVAATRAEHSLSILYTAAMHEADTGRGNFPVNCLNPVDELQPGMRQPIAKEEVQAIRGEKRIAELRERLNPSDEDSVQLSVAISRRPIVRTSGRVSYSNLADALKGDGKDFHRRSIFEEIIRQQDEEGEIGEESAGPRSAAGMPLWDLPKGGHVGDAFHAIFEHLDFGVSDLAAEVERVVTLYGSQKFLRAHREQLVKGILQVCSTPLGSELGNVTLCDLDPKLRAAEMRFEAQVYVGERVEVATLKSIGEYVVAKIGNKSDPLLEYAEHLSALKVVTPEMRLRGLLNGSIDTIIPVGTGNDVRFFVSDYKSNKLETPAYETPINRYLPENLFQVMKSEHYTLQALIYGVAMYRYLRWRAPHLDADRAVGGWSYLFLRGLLGEGAQSVENSTYGVTTWSSREYPGFWAGLSDVLMGVEQ